MRLRNKLTSLSFLSTEIHRRSIVSVGDKRVLQSLIKLMGSNAEKVRLPGTKYVVERCLHWRMLTASSTARRYVLQLESLVYYSLKLLHAFSSLFCVLIH